VSETLKLYDTAYGNFSSLEQAAVRLETFGEDIGQTSWMTADEWRRFADQLQLKPDTNLLEIGSGSGGPAVYLAEARRSRVTGVEVNPFGVTNGEELARRRGVSDRVQFLLTDGTSPLPLASATFDAIVANDSICHIADRLAALKDWHRVLRRGGRVLFTDALVVTGPISHREVAVRSSVGFYLFVPPGENERVLAEAGFTLLGIEDLTASTATVSQRRHAAREHYRDQLIEQEGEETFLGLQEYLVCVQRLAVERRLSRYSYLAEKARGAA
jgi:ubiquinone/menaquinone biosynthesis C-methylase UbiE